MTELLVGISNWCVHYWYLIPGIPVTIWLTIKLIRKFKHGRIGWDQFIIKIPIFGNLIEKNILARTTRTLGTLVSSGVPILEALNITRDTSGNATFEKMYQKVTEAIREGEAIAKPMKENSVPGFHPVAAFFWFCFCGGPIGVLLYLTESSSSGSSTTSWSTWSTSAKKRASSIRCSTRWPTPTTKKWPCSPKASRN